MGCDFYVKLFDLWVCDFSSSFVSFFLRSFVRFLLKSATKFHVLMLGIVKLSRIDQKMNLTQYLFGSKYFSKNFTIVCLMRK